MSSTINGAEILRLSALVAPLLASNNRTTARKHLEKILTLEVDEDDVEAIQAKEAAVYQFMKLLLVAKDGERLIQLLQHEVRPLFALLPKVKTTKIVRTLFDAIVECRVPLDRQEVVCRESIQWARQERRTFLRHRLELRLVEMVFQRRVKSTGILGTTSSPSTSSPTGSPVTGNALRESMHLVQTVLRELRRLDDRTLLLEAHLLESQIYYASRNIPKARAALVCARTTASSIYCSPLSQAQIDMQSGLVHIEERDYRTAFSYFYEAFEGFHSLGDEALPARQALRYLILAKIFSGTKEDVEALLSSSHVLAYNGPELKALRSIADAYFKSDTHLFNQILQQEQDRTGNSGNEEAQEVMGSSILQDEVVRRQLTEMYDALMERHLLKLILPYHRVQIEYLADLLGQDRQDVELRISQLILDKQIHGIVDQEHHCLCIFDDAEEERARRKQMTKLTRRSKAASAAVVVGGSGRGKAPHTSEKEKGGEKAASPSPNQLVGAAHVSTTTSLYDDALEAITEYDKLVTALFDKVGGKFDALVDAAREAREARKKVSGSDKSKKKNEESSSSNTNDKKKSEGADCKDAGSGKK